eukprot:CAMPEP_0182426362 /NCGR_PEP_ID=MMETSP1167-20130531/12841_1 /TAXON_ID=2988 /ORGANISM="Mallomonas Sp, Strain CCMP3275" /LENGTH=718 /DNA_ID=CAMNT_0024607723 /DNA_START=78 /DNA_END=2234 /DNA_ORIENTATION=+
MEREIDSKDYFSQTAPERFGGQKPSADLSARIRKINEIEIVEESNKRHPHALPAETEDEKLYTLELDRLGRLRQLYDRTKDDRDIRKKTLTELKEKVNERIHMDEKVTASLMMGEMAIAGLEARHQSLIDALEEAKLLNGNYNKLVKFLDANPPYTQLHISAVEQQIVLVRAQLEDLRHFRVSLYSDIERIELLNEADVQPQIAELKEKRKLIQTRLKHQQSTNSKLQARLVSMSIIPQTEGHNSEESLSGLDSKRSHSPSGSPMEGARMSSGLRSPLASRGTIQNRPLTNESMVTEQSDDFGLDYDDRNKENLQFESLLQRTGVASAEEFLSRYRAAQRLHDSLRSHQNLAESRLSNLRTEFTDLSAAWAQAQLVSRSDDPPDKAADVEREARYLDQKLFKMEMKSSQLLRQTEKAVLGINEIRSGVMHMASLIQSKDNLLYKLPGNSAPPECNNDDDITRVLSWCEERVIAINEALVLDSSKPAATDDTQPFNSRQTQLAALVLANMKKVGNEARQKSRVQSRKKTAGGMSQSLIMSKESSALDSLGGVRILAKDASEKQYEAQVENEQKQREEIISQKDLRANRQRPDDSVEELQGYLSVALNSNNTKHALRRANHLEGKSMGKNAGFGWALDDFIGKQGEEKEGAVGKNRRRKDVSDSSQFLDRMEIKNMKSQRNSDRRQLSDVSGADSSGEGQQDMQSAAAPPPISSRRSNRY